MPTTPTYEMHLSDLGWIGLGLVLLLALGTAPAWGPDVLAWIRRTVETRRVTRYTQPHVKDFQKSEKEKGADGMVSKAPLSPIPSAVPKSSTATCTGDTGFSVDQIPPDLTYREMVTVMARWVDANGKPRLSGKKIYASVGGNYGEFVALMQALRPKDSDPAEEPTVLTPIAGRPTKASLYEDRPTFRETDPDLAYQPPE